jgi:hypothetical protein
MPQAPPAKRCPFPQSTRSQVWLALCQSLQGDPVLHGAVDTWQLWDGSEDSTMEPTEENLPLFRMTPVSGNQRWLDENAQECVMLLKVECGVEGLVLTDILDYWAAIEAALFTGNILLNILYPFQVIQKTITTPAVGIKMFGAKSGLAAEGVLTIRMRINS